MEHFWLEVIGFTAQGLFILSFLLLGMDKIEEDSLAYNLMNLVAAILAIIYYGWFYAIAGVMGNIIWGFIACYGFVRFLKNKRDKEVIE